MTSDSSPLASTSFTSVPPSVVATAKRLAADRRMRLWQIYSDAILELQRHLQSEPGSIRWAASIGPGGSSYPVRLSEDAAQALRDISRTYQVKRVTVFLTALELYLPPS